MRLIDSDALIKDCKRTVQIADELKELNIKKTFSAMLNLVLTQPTIDAIPIDYMRSQVDSGKWEEIITRWREHEQTDWRQTMSDLISRHAAIDALGDAHFKNYGNAIMVIQALPSAEPKKGKWTHDGGYFKNRWICSECGYKWFSTKESGKFCAHCGARMDEE